MKIDKNLFTGRYYKFCIFFLLFVSLCCVQLCANTKNMTPEESKEAREKLIEEAKSHIGQPYSYAQAGPNKFDCSGFVYYCYKTALKINLSKSSSGIYNAATRIEDSELEPGDLVFFEAYKNGRVSHVGIYLGNNQFISAISDGPRTGIQIASLSEDYWKKNYMCAGRILPSSKSAGNVEIDDDEDVPESPKSESTPDPVARNKKPGNSTVAKNKTSSKSSSSAVDKYFMKLEDLSGDMGIFVDWTLPFQEKNVFEFRGLDFQLNIYLSKNKTFKPGVGVFLDYDTIAETVKIPVVLSFTFSNFLRMYLGPVISLTNMPYYINSKTDIPDFISLLIGFGVYSKKITLGKLKFFFAQDMSYNYFFSKKQKYTASEFFQNCVLFRSGIRVAFN